jgi:hypothetical protein
MKRKVVLDCTLEYVIPKDVNTNFSGGWIKVDRMVPVAAEYKTKDNVGGEVWDWAQSHWDEFLDAAGPEVVIDDVTYPTELRWCCVTGVLDAKGKNHLPIKEKTWASYSHPRAKDAKPKTSRKTKKTTGTPRRGVKAAVEKVKKEDKPQQAAGVPTSHADYVAEQIKAVMEMEEEVN